MKDNNDLGVVGNIKIATPKHKKDKKKKKSNTSNTPIGVKVFVWMMFIAMLGASFAPLIVALIDALTR